MLRFTVEVVAVRFRSAGEDGASHVVPRKPAAEAVEPTLAPLGLSWRADESEFAVAAFEEIFGGGPPDVLLVAPYERGPPWRSARPPAGARWVQEHGGDLCIQHILKLTVVAHHGDDAVASPPADLFHPLFVAVAGLEVELPWTALVPVCQDTLKYLSVQKFVRRQYD